MNKYLDDAGLGYIWSKICAKLDTKVEKEAGKGLSTNDFTDEYKDKIAEMAGVNADTTEHWNSKLSYIPKAGEIIVYADKGTIEVDGETIAVPGIKIGDGKAYLIDLPFVGDDITGTIIEQLEQHITNEDVHVTPALKQKWNDKITVDKQQEVVDETLILTRN